MTTHSAMTRLLRRGLSAAFLGGAALPAWAGVLVVDEAGGAGADFLQIEAAVTAAQDGDTILVRPGEYQTFSVAGKSLSIVADGEGVLAKGVPAFRVEGLAQDQEVLVRGLRCIYYIHVASCAGSVWIDEVQSEHGTNVGLNAPPCYGGVGLSGAIPGAWVTDSPRVTFTRCSLRGSTGIDGPDPVYGLAWAGSGLRVARSGVRAFDCEILGGPGHSSTIAIQIDPGGEGLFLENATVTLVGCTVRGGPGGVHLANPCGGTHPAGGAGVRFFGDLGVLRSAASTAAGGAADLDLLCPGLSGPAGAPIAGTGTIVALAGHARHLRANSPVRGGDTLTFELEGQPGETPLLLLSLAHEPIDLLGGSLLIGLPPTDAFVLPALPADGQASLGFAVPGVGPALESLHLYAQAAFLDATPAIWLGAGTTVVLLDGSP